MANHTKADPKEIEAIISRVEVRLAELGEPQGVNLRVDRDSTKYEDDWLFVSVAPPTSGGHRASEYSEWLSMIERELRDDRSVTVNVLLVPVVPDN